MTQISLSKIYAIIDRRRGELLEQKKKAHQAAVEGRCSPAEPSRVKAKLELLNQLKEEFALVSDSDQRPLGI